MVYINCRIWNLNFTPVAIVMQLVNALVIWLKCISN